MDSPSTTTNKPKLITGFAHWMHRVLEECQRAAVDLAPDPVHDLRVALRRCRSMADGLMAIDPDSSWKDMKKAGKRLFRSLGELRDVHVMREWVEKLGPKDDPETQALLSLLASREQEHKVVAAEAVRVFDVREWRKWCRELPRRAARVKRGSLVFKHLALERWMEAHELHRRALRNRSQTAFHQLRIGIKRFRYIVENFLPQQHEKWSGDLKELQDLLGDVHDLDVLWATAAQINAFGTHESRERWHGLIRETREKRIARYRELMIGPTSRWNEWRADLPQGDQIQTAAMLRFKLWASFLDPDFARSERVADLASQLYTGLRRLGLTPDNSERDPGEILQVAALLHDVGRAKREKGHHKASYRLVQKIAPPLGWKPVDLQLAATVARFHRGALPQSHQKLVRALAPEQKKLAIYLAGILRLATAFDGTGSDHVRRLQVDASNGAVRIGATAYSPWSSAGEHVAAGRHLLELVLRKPVVVKALKNPPRRQGARQHLSPA